MRSYYSVGVAAPVILPITRPLALAHDGLSGLARGDSAKALWRAGIRPISRMEVGGFMKEATGFIMDGVHLVLLIGGVWLLITAIMAL